MEFYVGLHQPHDAKHFERVFVSVNRLRRRVRPFEVRKWIMDSGAFTTIAKHGAYPESVATHAAEIRRWKLNGELVAAVAQDWMCEPFVLRRTGLSVRDHQALTVERYYQLSVQDCGGVMIMPVLQGYAACEYLIHLRMYGELLDVGAYVGVGSVCKRNADVFAVERVLAEIKSARPDLRLHGFGLKKTALASARVRALLYSADSLAWSFAARRQGRDGNDWREARAFADAIG